MKTIASISLIFALIFAGSSATRADDISELVAAVADAHQTEKSIPGDGFLLTFDSLPRYKSTPKGLDSDLLEGIYASMALEGTFDYILNAYDIHADARREGRRHAMEYERRASRPTLAMRNFFRPVPGTITSFYGWRPQFGRLHHGVDLHLNVGDTVRAALPGRVEKIAYDHHGYGHYLVVRHRDGMSTLYGHLSYAIVGQGQIVGAGEPIGIGGNTGNSTGPHLHFEAKIGEISIDPTLIFDFYGRARYAPEETTSESVEGEDGRKSLAGKRTYVVRQGDTAKSVAKRAGITVAKLCQLNMLKSDAPLEVGRMLKIN